MDPSSWTNYRLYAQQDSLQSTQNFLLAQAQAAQIRYGLNPLILDCFRV